MSEWRTERGGREFIWDNRISEKLWTKHFLTTGEAEDIFLQGAGSVVPHPQKPHRWLMEPEVSGQIYRVAFVIEHGQVFRIITCHPVSSRRYT